LVGIGTDDKLTRLVEAWPSLPSATRQRIMVLVEAADGKPQE